MQLPERVQLPSRRVIALQARAGLGRRARRRGAPRFSEMVELVTSGDLTLSDGEGLVDVFGLELRDFHALRAIATRIGLLDEQPVEISCRNCGHAIRLEPCAGLELGPFIDAELDDQELDQTLDLTESHPIPAIDLGAGRVAREATMGPVTVATAAPLHRALRRRRLLLSERVVTAMGIGSLGPELSPRNIAAALEHGSDETWDAIVNLFLAAHYPLRLSAIVICPECGARNDVDAPYEREFEPRLSALPSNTEVFPEFDAFDACAHGLFDRLAADQTPYLALVIDAEIPACDEGGQPLLGAYVPPAGDPWAPIGVGEITVYYRSFRALWNEDGPYGWEAELEETLTHELEHHRGWRTGHDALDDDEREDIERERALLVGRKRTMRRSVVGLGVDVGDFVARTWPIWLIVALSAIAITVCGK
jgi:hypothetical protein